MKKLLASLLTLCTFSFAATPAPVNCNDLRTTGIHPIGALSTTTNCPISGVNLQIQVTRPNNGSVPYSILQVATDSNANVFSRVETGSAWSAWKQTGGGQNRYCTANVAILAANASATGTCTYATTFPTSTYSVQAILVESTANVPVSVKVTAVSASGFTYSVTNLSSTTAFSGAASVNGMAVGH